MRSLKVSAVALAFVAGCSAAPVGSIGGDSSSNDRTATDVAAIVQHQHAKVCSGGRFTCRSHVVISPDTGAAAATSGPSGFGAADLASAYKLDTTASPGATIAVVDAYGYANAASDLAAYRTQMGLPSCTIANGCLKIVNQSGKTSPLPSAPPAGDDWTVETALDLDMASAACPNCKLLLVQANDDTSDGLYIAQAAAAALGATVISNSWGGAETASDPATNYESYFNLANVGIFAASGDNGYDNGGQGANYPATSAYVTAVGGTSLVKSSSAARGWVETAWATSSNGEGGSGCSLSIPKPSFQKTSACAYRASSDISAVGDPNTGLAVYNAKNGGWIVVGGTSAATPFVAGVYALTGHAKAGPSFAYSNAGDFYDVTSGSNGSCGNVLCNAGAGWDGPTGMGTPNGAALKGGTTCTPACGSKACGSDGCGGSCGTCASGTTCNSSGQCSSTCTPACAGKTCGSDGCGGSCGTCASGTSCNTSGTCVAACTPSCSGKTCGSDGCGGTCGTCGAGTTCNTAGSCGSTSTCSHAICGTGKRLTKACDPCATEICAKDPYCCSTKWDSICVGEVSSICGEGC
ncbi:MAG: hypothetical protein ACHREM_17610 [Polyangiales bacterium]